MKNLIVSLALLSFAAAAVGQQTEPAQKPAQGIEEKTLQAPAEKKIPPSNEFVKMKNGKLWHTKDGTTTELTKEIMLGETKIKPDGTVILKDGTTSKLKEDNLVNKNGNVIDVAAFRQKALEQKQAGQKATDPK